MMIPNSINGQSRGESIAYPQKQIVPAGEIQRRIDNAGGICLRKYDGEFSTAQIAGAVIIAERMKLVSGHFYTAADYAMFALHGEFYAALTVASWHGENVLAESADWRWNRLCALEKLFPSNVILAERVRNVAETMASGAEGVMYQNWCDAWGNFLCHKVLSKWICRVTKTGNTQSVGICDAQTGLPMGNVKMSGGRADRLRVGSLVKIEGLGLTEKGFIREPRPCKDSENSWLVSY